MMVEVARGVAAWKLLNDASFIRDWERLRSRCPWATSFQGPSFASAWYRSYADEYGPLLVLSGVPQELRGLLALGTSATGRNIVNVGGQQAEYQAWLCTPEAANVFPWQAIRAAQQASRASRLAFRYLPPLTPLDWLNDREPKRVCRLERHSRPLLWLGDGTHIAESLRKKGNRSRVNRLKRIGRLQFEKITDPAAFATVMDEIISYYDFRQGATHDSLPFRDDKRKRAFHLAMAQHRNLLHITLLRIGDRIGSAHIGVLSGEELQLGIIAHNPFFSQHSPGKFHVFFLAQMLLREGCARLDLTPGGDAYKERFANAHDTVHTLGVHSSALRLACHDLCEEAVALAQPTLSKLRVTPAKMRAVLTKVKRIRPIGTPLATIRKASGWVYRRREMLVYRYAVQDIPAFEPEFVMSRDNLDDLLAYHPAEAWQTRNGFLRAALQRIEAGLHAYTHAEDGRLLHYGWLIERQEKSFLTEVRQEFRFRANSACVFDFYTVPCARGRGLYQANLQTMLADAARIPDTGSIYITVLANNGPSRHVIEKVGFTYDTSLLERVWLGRATRWTAARTDP